MSEKREYEHYEELGRDIRETYRSLHPDHPPQTHRAYRSAKKSKRPSQTMFSRCFQYGLYNPKWGAGRAWKHLIPPSPSPGPLPPLRCLLYDSSVLLAYYHHREGERRYPDHDDNSIDTPGENRITVQPNSL